MPKMIFKDEKNGIANGILYFSIVTRLLAGLLLLGTIAKTKNCYGMSAVVLMQNAHFNWVSYIPIFKYVFVYPLSDIISRIFLCTTILHLINTGVLWLTWFLFRFHVKIFNEEKDDFREIYLNLIYLLPIILMGDEYSPTEIVTIYTRHIASAATIPLLQLTTKMRKVRPTILLYITILVVSQIASTISSLMKHYLDIKGYFGFIIPSIIQDVIYIYFLIKILLLFISKRKETIRHLDAQMIEDIPLEIKNADSRNLQNSFDDDQITAGDEGAYSATLTSEPLNNDKVDSLSKVNENEN